MNNPTKTPTLLLFIATIMILLFFAGCQDQHCGDLTMEEITITNNIQGVIIEGPWHVTISQDSLENSAFLEYSLRDQKYVTAQLLPNGYLHIKLSASWKSSRYNCSYRATIKAMNLEKIEGSGATTILTSGHFANLNHITLSGASVINGLSCKGTSARIVLSGASTLKSFIFEGSDINAELSGASSATFDNVNLNYCEVKCTGASKFKSSGYAAKTSFTGSGASDFQTLNLESENLDIDLSGASEGVVRVNNTIKGRLSGASVLKYKKGANVSEVHLSGESRLIALD